MHDDRSCDVEDTSLQSSSVAVLRTTASCHHVPLGVEIGRVRRVERECYEDPREDVTTHEDATRGKRRRGI